MSEQELKLWFVIILGVGRTSIPRTGVVCAHSQERVMQIIGDHGEDSVTCQMIGYPCEDQKEGVVSYGHQ